MNSAPATDPFNPLFSQLLDLGSWAASSTSCGGAGGGTGTGALDAAELDCGI